MKFKTCAIAQDYTILRNWVRLPNALHVVRMSITSYVGLEESEGKAALHNGWTDWDPGRGKNWTSYSTANVSIQISGVSLETLCSFHFDTHFWQWPHRKTTANSRRQISCTGRNFQPVSMGQDLNMRNFLQLLRFWPMPWFSMFQKHTL